MSLQQTGARAVGGGLAPPEGFLQRTPRSLQAATAFTWLAAVFALIAYPTTYWLSTSEYNLVHAGLFQTCGDGYCQSYTFDCFGFGEDEGCAERLATVVLGGLALLFLVLAVLVVTSKLIRVIRGGVVSTARGPTRCLVAGIITAALAVGTWTREFFNREEDDLHTGWSFHLFICAAVWAICAFACWRSYLRKARRPQAPSMAVPGITVGNYHQQQQQQQQQQPYYYQQQQYAPPPQPYAPPSQFSPSYHDESGSAPPPYDTASSPSQPLLQQHRASQLSQRAQPHAPPAAYAPASQGWDIASSPGSGSGRQQLASTPQAFSLPAPFAPAPSHADAPSESDLAASVSSKPFCPTCGAALPGKAKVCSTCGSLV